MPRSGAVELEFRERCLSFSSRIPLLLGDLCLNAIAKYFPMYAWVFTTSKHEFVKRMLEFLQRKCSYDILIRLRNKPEGCLDLLINKHLSILETTWLINYSWKKVTSKMAEIGSGVQEIIITGDHFFGMSCKKKPWQKIMCYFPNLKVITLEGFSQLHRYGLILKSVARFCPNIEEIDFQYACITFEIAKNLCKSENGKALCTKLKKLHISTSYGNLSALAYFIENFRTLEIVNNPDLPFMLYSLHKNDVLYLDKVEPYNIHILNFTKYAPSPVLADILKVCLSVCPHLKSVIFGFVYKLDFFPSLPNLEQLKIINFLELGSKININSLLESKQKKLTSLKIKNCIVSLSVLAESCPCVKELILDDVDLLFDDDSKPVFDLLSSCTFDNIDVSMNAKAISFLLASSRLESLAFRGCNMLSSEVETLILRCCESYSVKKISFCSSEIQKKFLRDLLLNCTSLKNLNILHCFDRDDENELLKLAKILPNKPEFSNYQDYDIDCDEMYFDDGDYMYDSHDWHSDLNWGYSD